MNFLQYVKNNTQRKESDLIIFESFKNWSFNSFDLFEARALNNKYLKTKYPDTMKEVTAEVDEQLKSKVVPVYGPKEDGGYNAIRTFMIFSALESNIKPSESADLFHDIISEFDKNGLSQFFPMMKTVEAAKYSDIKDKYNKMKGSKDDKMSDDEAWDIVRKSYVELPNQEELKIENFKGSGETKIIPIDSGAKWIVGTTIPEDELKTSKLYKNLTPDGKKALTKASQKGDLALRGACPLDSRDSKHCGNLPSNMEGDIFLMLKEPGSKQSMASVVVDADGLVRESKAPGNTSVIEKYYNNMVWLFLHEWVDGTIWGGYAPDRNFFPYKLKDQELKDHLYSKDSGKKWTDQEKIVGVIKDAYDSGELTIDEVFDMATEGVPQKYQDMI